MLYSLMLHNTMDTLERMVFISFVDLKLVEDINPSKFGGLHGVEPFWNIKQGEDTAGAATAKLQTAQH